MKAAALRAHYDGERIRLDEPAELEPGAPLTAIVGGRNTESDEDDDWYLLSAEGLAAAYGEDEPEYTLDMIKEPNPD
jgi:hypothetical protein